MSGGFWIGIPTYKRPESLRKLIEALLPQLEPGCGIVVADNECSPAIEAIVASFADRCAIHYVAVAAKGVSHVRNAIVARVLEVAPDLRWLGMVDDDGVVMPGWRLAMERCGERFAADVIGGAVEGELPPGAGRLARNSLFARRDRSPTGPIDLLITTQNVVFAAALLKRLDKPLFDPRYGLSGGEDYDLFRRAKQAGARFVWCDEAEVYEPAPPERLTARSLIYRYFSSGVYCGMIDSRFDGRPRTLLAYARRMARGGGKLAVSAVTGRRDVAAHTLLGFAYACGGLASMVGYRSSRYAQ